jgi:hypothetical protein
MGCDTACEDDRPIDDDAHSTSAEAEHAEEIENLQEVATEEEQVDATEPEREPEPEPAPAEGHSTAAQSSSVTSRPDQQHEGMNPPMPAPAEAEHPQDPQIDFSDLFTGPGCPIPRTELRAISLHQLNLVEAHVTRRLTGGEVWKAKRFESGQMVEKDLTDPAKAQLYDVATHVIVAATAELQLSLVEAMSTTEQQGLFFTSHS